MYLNINQSYLTVHSLEKNSHAVMRIKLCFIFAVQNKCMEMYKAIGNFERRVQVSFFYHKEK